MKLDRQQLARTTAFGGLFTLGLGLLAAPSAAQTLTSVPEEEFVISTPELGGYQATAVSSPISIELFEPVIPVPAAPGEPHGEMHASFSQATLGSGPTARGLGSSVWPGATAGDGLSAFDPNIPAYPFKASAFYPQGPFEQLADSGDPQTDRGDAFTRTGMFAYARGVDVYGESNGGGELIPGVFAVGSMKTVSTTNIVDGIVISETIATMSDISILAGIITIDGMQTRLVAQSNGELAQTDGTYEVSGIEINGQGFELTDEGLTPTDDQGPGETIGIPFRDGTINLQEEIGIKFEPAPVIEELDGPTGERSTRGLMITIDTGPLHDLLGNVPLTDIIDAIPNPGIDVIPCSEFPDEFSPLPCFSNPSTAVKANAYTIAGLEPITRFILGGARVSTSSSLPFTFTPVTLPPLPPPPPPVTTTTTTNGPAFSPPPATRAPAPEVAAPESLGRNVQFVAMTIPEGTSRGIGAGLILLGALGIFGGGRFGKRLTLQAIYGGAAPAEPARDSVPDLRAFARGEKP